MEKISIQISLKLSAKIVQLAQDLHVISTTHVVVKDQLSRNSLKSFALASQWLERRASSKGTLRICSMIMIPC